MPAGEPLAASGGRDGGGILITVKCDWCQSSVNRFPSKVHPTNFCNKQCQGQYRSANLTATRAANWKGGVKGDRDRVLWHMPWHPRADRRGYVYRYIVSAELGLGRHLQKGEVVHHLDGDHTNDHPENLMVLPSQSEHARLHNFQRSRKQNGTYAADRKAS